MYSTCCPQLPAPLSAKPQQPAALLQWHLPGAQTPGGTTRTLSWHGAPRQLPRKTQLPAVSSTACLPCALVTLMLTRMARSTLLSLTNCARTLPLCLVVSVWPLAGRRSMALSSDAQPPARPCLTCLTSARALLVAGSALSSTVSTSTCPTWRKPSQTQPPVHMHPCTSSFW